MHGVVVFFMNMQISMYLSRWLMLPIPSRPILQMCGSW